MIPAALRIPAFRRLVLSSTLSQLGSMLTFIALPLVLWEETGSAAAYAAAIGAGSLALIFAKPLGGVFADRFDRRRLMMATDLVGIIAMLSMLAIVHWRVWVAVPIVSFAHNFFSNLGSSAGPALRRDVLPEEHRLQGNALLTLANNSTALIAPVAGAVLYAAAGFEVVAIVDIATYAMSLLLIFRLRGVRTRPERQRSTAMSVRGALSTTARDLRCAARAIGRDAYLKVSLIPAVLSGIANGLLLVAAVPWFDRSLHAPESSFGVMFAILGGTGIVSSLLLARYPDRFDPVRLLQLGSIGCMFAPIAFVGTPPLPLVWLGAMLFGSMTTVMAVADATIDQRRIPSGLQGRVGSASMLVFHVGFFGGSIGGGVLISAAGPVAAMSSFAAFIFVASVGYLAVSFLARGVVVLTDADVDSIVRGASLAARDEDLAVSG